MGIFRIERHRNALTFDQPPQHIALNCLIGNDDRALACLIGDFDLNRIERIDLGDARKDRIVTDHRATSPIAPRIDMVAQRQLAIERIDGRVASCNADVIP